MGFLNSATGSWRMCSLSCHFLKSPYSWMKKRTSHEWKSVSYRCLSTSELDGTDVDTHYVLFNGENTLTYTMWVSWWRNDIHPMVESGSKIVICARLKNRYVENGHPTFSKESLYWENKTPTTYYWWDDHPIGKKWDRVHILWPKLGFSGICKMDRFVGCTAHLFGTARANQWVDVFSPEDCPGKMFF